MIPRKLALRNFMCYRSDVPTLDFEGITIACLSGENGAGKSALLDALTWALWGEARLRSDDDLIALGEQEMMVDLTFALDGRDYRVLRRRAKGKRTGQSQLEFQHMSDNGWKVLNPGMSIRETQQLIDQTLRMGFETFSNSAFLRQGRADEFTRKEPSKRKQVLADILGLSVYEQLETASKGRTRELDGQTRSVDGQIEAYRSQSEKRELYMQLVSEAEHAAHERAANLDTAQKRYDEVLAQLQALEARVPFRDERKRQAERLHKQREELALKIQRTQELIVKARQRIDKAAEIRAGIARLDAAKAEQERLEALRDSYDNLQKQRREQEQALRELHSRIEADLRVVEAELRSLREHAKRRPKLAQELQELSTRLEQLAPISEELEQTRRSRGDLQERARLAGRLQLERLQNQTAIDKRRDSLIASREELKRRVKDVTDRLKDEARWQTELVQAQQEQSALQQQLHELEHMRLAEAEATEQLGALRAACDTIKSQGDQINEKLHLITDETASCPLCGSALGHDGLTHIRDEFQRERTSLRSRYSQARDTAKQAEQELKNLQKTIESSARQTAGLSEIAARIARYERELQNAEELRQRQREDQRQLDDVHMQIMKGDYEQALRAELARIEGELVAVGNPESIDTELKRTERRVAELEKQLGEQANLEAQVQRRRDELRRIDDEDPALHEQELRQRELTTTLEMENYGHGERLAMKQLDSSIAALGFSPEKAAAAREEMRLHALWVEELNRLERAEEWLAENEPLAMQDQAVLHQRDAELVEIEAELRILDEQLRGLVAATRTRSEAQAELREAQAAQRAVENDLSQKRALLSQSEEAAATLLEREAERSRLVERRGLFEELSQAFGKKGVQALLIETAIPEIERESNTLLASMTDNQMHLRFETQGETKKGDVTETLDIKIADSLGTRDYDAYSGGESFRVDFSIRVALAKLLARRAGARLETLVIDEGFGSQDARGRERLVEAITSIQRDFRQILVVTHIQELKDMFPVQIEVVKTAEGSRWEIA